VHPRACMQMQVPEVYAAGEKITRRRTLYCVGAYGIVARNGKVLVKGMVWGEDIIIHNEYLIESANAIALIVSEVLVFVAFHFLSRIILQNDISTVICPSQLVVSGVNIEGKFSSPSCLFFPAFLEGPRSQFGFYSGRPEPQPARRVTLPHCRRQIRNDPRHQKDCHGVQSAAARPTHAQRLRVFVTRQISRR